MFMLEQRHLAFRTARLARHLLRCAIAFEATARDRQRLFSSDSRGVARRTQHNAPQHTLACVAAQQFAQFHRASIARPLRARRTSRHTGVETDGKLSYRRQCSCPNPPEDVR